jgi:hypothetical protein
MPLSDIVNVNITRQSQSVSEQGFGTLMILGVNKAWNDVIRQYSNMQQVAQDFNPWDADYIAAQDVFSQAITPPFIYIGRRTVDTVDVTVETAMTDQNYTTTINGTAVTINSTPSVQQSVVTLSGIVTWLLTFSTNFNSDTTGIVATVNGVALASVPWDTNQATTIGNLATVIAAASGVSSATVTSTDVITVVFDASDSSVVNSVIVNGTGSQPTCALTQDGPLVTSNVITFSVNGVSQTPITFATNSLDTMDAIATAIEGVLNTGYSPGIATVVVSGPNNNVLSVTSNPNQSGIINSFVVTMGASQATAAIVNTNQPVDANVIAAKMATAITAASLGVTGSVPGTPNGTYSVTASVSGVPYTIAVSTNIVNPNACRILITQAIPNQAYTVKIDGFSFIYQAPYNVSTSDQISAGLVALINADTSPVFGVVTATDNGNGSFELASASPFLIQAFPFESIQIQKGLIIGPYVPSSSVVTDLEAIQDVNDDWYALACTDRTVATVESIAAWIETQMKIFGTASSDPDIINEAPGTDVTSIAYVFQTAGYVRSFVIYHQDAAEDYPECAWFGNCLPLTPGSETWAFKTLASIPYSDLSTNQESNAFGKNCNTYEFIGGVGITQNGVVAVGEYIDTVRGVDWLTSTIQSFVYSVLVNNPKVPYTDSGIAAIESQIRNALALGITNNFIASEPPIQVIVPLAVNVPPINKVNRILQDVSFTATLAGAIQAITINGTVSV